MSRNKHRSRLLAEAKAKGLCRPPPKPGGAERHRQHQINTHAKYVRRAWLQVVRDDKVSYRQRMDAQLAHREAEHQSAIANLRCQLASAQIAAERNAEDAARSAAEAAEIAKQAAQAAQQTQIRHTEYRQALCSAIWISSVTLRISQHQRWRKRRRQCGRWMSTSAKEPQYLASCLHRQRRCVMLTVSGTVQCTITKHLS